MGRPAVRIARNSHLRYASFVEVDGIGFWKPTKLPLFEPKDGDIVYTWTSIDRIDILARKYYGDTRLMWVLMWANDLSLPETQLYPGKKIRIPTRSRILREVLRGG